MARGRKRGAVSATMEEQIQKQTDDMIKEVDRVIAEKEKEILAV